MNSVVQGPGDLLNPVALFNFTAITRTEHAPPAQSKITYTLCLSSTLVIIIIIITINHFRHILTVRNLPEICFEPWWTFQTTVREKVAGL